MNIHNISSLGQTPQPDLRMADATRKSASHSAETQQKREPSRQEVQKAVESINLALQRASKSTALQFTVDPNTRTTVVKVMDTESGELIRQFPSEAALAIAESIGDLQKGLLLGQEA
jgi:flagellar protein FlaG